MFGNLTIDALPFYSWVAMSGALVTVGGALAVMAGITWLGQWRNLWSEWLTSVDHKRIGIMYVILALIMLMRGFIDAIMMRSQQAISLNSDGYLPPGHFDQIFSSHGTIMVFFMAMPFLTGLINIVVPQQIGARDVAFPFVNSVSLWLTTAGAGLILVSLVIGKFSTAGWTGYPPYSGVEYSPGVGVDYWLWAILISGVGTTLTGINFVVTILKLRAPGMNLMRMPLFVWTALCTSILMTFAFPALTVVASLLWLDRTIGMHFFTNAGGGNMMNYANLFWIWGHPEVYILILPAFGIYSEVVATFSAKRLFGYTSLVYATASIAVLSFTVWLHHFFTMGASANVNAFFGIATMIIAVPTGVKVFDWLFTMYRGRITFHPSMLWTLGFIVTFVIGGMTGVLLALPPVNYLVHNTTFLVAHFHNMLIPGALFGYFAGYMYWFPKAFGFELNERWGVRSFWCWLIGFYLAFMPLYVLGLMGMPRRMEHYNIAQWQPYLIVAALGAALILLGIIFLIVQLVVSVRHRQGTVDLSGDPWNGRTLEWLTSSPPAPYNFAVVPDVRDIDAFHDMKKRGVAYRRPDRYQDIYMPRSTGAGVFLGVLAFLLGFAMVWHIWWMAIACTIGMWAVIIARTYNDDTEYRLSAADVEKIEDRRYQALASAARSRNVIAPGLSDQPVTESPT
ncbi:cytochrome o ubiquinol oxidase subunit I [Pseudorhodoplanes sinuspersici]|uniref:Cytochrome o ubiquinol oxidase subunit I n=1 Tax=Pseudorhodoplanes sinuspersici TaxID=1235591 RepID=A0A1W6ZKF1_9HYPH|nr:cytochrome o ubiquinol oxidase subunit I [Pseudorhodoplanes sinuspersici]ARP97792.1 cytochrome o ubiquinol oxidase subunit I [Pseudorhodoplanes sinuspersici]RKE68481.1 cytochrome bo3 quinol oxidase subunit 1 apoprotein [Pseudorhodoplanes sinuspersici]